MTGSCLSAGCPGCRQPKSPAAAVSVRPRMLSQLEGEVLHRVSRLRCDAERLAKSMGRMADVDEHAVERGMIALRRALSQLEDSVTRNEVNS